MEFVNGVGMTSHIIIMENKIPWFQTTNQLYMFLDHHVDMAKSMPYIYISYNVVPSSYKLVYNPHQL